MKNKRKGSVTIDWVSVSKTTILTYKMGHVYVQRARAGWTAFDLAHGTTKPTRRHFCCSVNPMEKVHFSSLNFYESQLFLAEL
jgi:hypothetical protein